MSDGRLRGRVSRRMALVAAIVAGGALSLAFPGASLGWLAPFAVALTLTALRGRSFRFGALLGLVGGLAFWLPLISWIRFFLGDADAAGVGLVLLGALSLFMSLWGALGAGLIAVVLGRSATDARWRLGIVPVAVAGLWTAREALSATIPWGGFSWGRIGFSQAEGPLKELLSWVGTSGVTFLVVWLAALAVEAAHLRPVAITAARRRGALLSAPARSALVVGAAAVLVGIPGWAVPASGSIRIGAVQGDTKSSYADPPKYLGDVLAKQLAETRRLEGRDVDLVVWPEGGSDLDPLRDATAARAWTAVVERIGAPLLGWTVTERGGKYYNTSLVWTADGPGERYDKAHPVPFGEYVPARAVFHAIVPGLVDLLQREYTPGTGSPAITVDGRTVGVFICFDIADDELSRRAALGGAQVLLAPSNNTDFGRGTAEAAQQLQIEQVRALETGRTLIAVSTVTPSAQISADSTVSHRLPAWRPGAFVATAPLATGVTPAVLLGGGLEFGLGALGVAGWLCALVGPRRRDR